MDLTFTDLIEAHENSWFHLSDDIIGRETHFCIHAAKYPISVFSIRF